MNKILSAVAKSHFAISEASVPGQLLALQAMMQGNAKFADEDLPEDDFLQDAEPSEYQSDNFAGKIAVMSVRGVIMHYGGMCSYGAEDYAARINQYAADDSISGLIILADTPGGQVNGLETLRESVINFSKAKPSILLINDGMLCSGGIWGFSGVTEMYASNMLCEAGSVGVLARIMDIRKALEMNGFKEVIIRAPQSKDKARTIEDALNGKTAELEAELEFTCNRFFTVVETDRAGKISGDEWKTGKVFFAEEAQRIGLIDGIKSYTEVVARMQELIVENSNNQNNMFGNKFPKMAALKGAQTIAAADLEAVNEEINAFGIPGVTLCLDSELQAHADNAAKITGLGAKVTDLNTQLTAKTNRVTELEEKVTALEAKIAGAPAETPSSPAAEADEIPSTGAQDVEITETDAELALIRAASHR